MVIDDHKKAGSSLISVKEGRLLQSRCNRNPHCMTKASHKGDHVAIGDYQH